MARATDRDIPEIFVYGECENNSFGVPEAGIGVHCKSRRYFNVSEPLEGSQSQEHADLVAAGRALSIAISKGHSKVIIHTESKYLYKNFTDRVWLQVWRKDVWNEGKYKNEEKIRDILKVVKAMEKVAVKWKISSSFMRFDDEMEEAVRNANEGAKKRIIAVV